MIDYDALEQAGRCDCGRPLRGHRPLPRPAPLVSWKAAKETDPTIFVRKPNAAMVASHERYGRLRGGR